MVVHATATRSDALRLEISGSESLSLRAVGTVPGVAVLAAGGANGPGTGYVKTPTTTTVQYKAPGSDTYGAVVNIIADGDYVVEDGENAAAYIRVRVWTSYTIAGSEAEVTLTDRYDNAAGHDDVTASEASSGDITSWSVTLANDGPVDLLDVRCWIGSGVSGLEISDDDATWVTPDAEDHADVLTWSRLAAGDTTTLYVRRTIGASSASDTGILNLIEFGWDGM